MEFVVAGLLAPMSRDLGISLAQAGGLVSAFAFAAAVAGPPLTLAAARFEPRRVLALVTALFGAGNLVAALAPAYPVVLTVRMIEGAALPVFISVGAAAVAALAGPERQGRAIAQVNIGTILGLVAAIPAGVALAAILDWRTVFTGLGLFALAAAAALELGFPAGSAAPPGPALRQATILRSAGFLSHLALSAAVFAAMFAGYAYLAAFLEIEAGYGGPQVALLLMGFGAVGLVGNEVAGRVVGRWPTAATAGAILVVGLAAGGVSILGGRNALLLPLLAVWGTAHAAGFALCQVRVMQAGARAPAFAMSLNIAACNLGIALGAMAGGAVIETVGLAAIGLGTSALALLALALAALTARLGRASA